MAIWNIKERNELVRSNEFIDVAPVCLWGGGATPSTINVICLLYTSDAADE